MRIINRKFGREYQILDKFEAGISLIGAEVKSVRTKQMRLENSFVKLIGDEAYLINAEIPVYKFSRPTGYDPKRTRKLLLHKAELLRLKGKMASGSHLTIAPSACYNKGPLFKIEVALVKSRGEIGKKKLEKGRDIKRDQEKMAKEYMKT